MPRARRSAKLDSRSARQKLPVSGKPLYQQIGRGLHLGYRKNKAAGRWVMRRATAPGRYNVEVIGEADDVLPADGHSVLDFFQASRVAQERAGALRHPTKRDPQTYSVRMCFDDYFQAMGPRLKTARGSKSRVEALILPRLGDCLVAQLTAEQIRDWHNNLAGSAPLRRGSFKKPNQARSYDLSDPDRVRRRKSSANRLLTMLKSALNHAFQERYVSDDQAWRRVKPFAGVDAARIRFLEKDEIRRVLKVLDGAFGQLVRAALHTGARYGDLVNLQVRDFDAFSGTVLVARSKTDKSYKVHLTEEGVDFFGAACQNRPPNELTFAREDGRKWGPSHQQRPMEDLALAAHLAEPVSFHELRHTYASHAAMNGMPLLVLAHNLGHADTRMVERHYSHLSDGHKRETVRRTALRLDG